MSHPFAFSTSSQRCRTIGGPIGSPIGPTESTSVQNGHQMQNTGATAFDHFCTPLWSRLPTLSRWFHCWDGFLAELIHLGWHWWIWEDFTKRASRSAALAGATAWRSVDANQGILGLAGRGPTCHTCSRSIMIDDDISTTLSCLWGTLTSANFLHLPFWSILCVQSWFMSICLRMSEISCACPNLCAGWQWRCQFFWVRTMGRASLGHLCRRKATNYKIS